MKSFSATLLVVLTIFAASASASISPFGFHQTRKPVMGCNGQDSPQQCREKARNMAHVMWKEQIGEGNEQVSQLKQSFVTMTENLLTARSPQAWDKVTENRDQKYCPENNYFEFVPGTAASVTPNSPQTWTGSCFGHMQAKLTSKGGGNYSLTMGGSNANSSGCSDTYLLTTSYTILGVLDISALDSSQTLPFSVEGSLKELDIERHGVHIMFAPCGILGTIESIIKTVSLFVGEGEPLLERNAEFLKYKGIYDELKTFNETVDMDKSNIKSGDYLAIARFDGLDPLIMFGTGSRTGHSALAVWEGDQLYVAESTAADPFGKVYWPPPYGLIRTPWDRWIQLARKARYQVDLLPLSEEHAAKFDEDAYWSWFKQVEGMPYGFHNMLYSFMDTADPNRNFPKPLGNWELHAVVNLWSMAFPPDSETSAYSLFIAALNQRTNQSCQKVDCVTDWLLQNNKTLSEMTAVPEQDSWLYDNGQNYSMVCSAFAAHGWKVGLKGVIPVFEATEQTPKDNYQMNMFSSSRFDASVCGVGLHSSSQGNYCQIMGDYWMDLNDYNSIPLYTQMNNHCPSQWPDYFRCPDSNPKCC